MAYIFKDINVRDPFVTDSTSLVLEDSKVVIQSLHRLLTTQEGTIPYFRSYGLDIKQFSQYPFTKDTIDTIYSYVKNRIKAFEPRVQIEKVYVDSSIEKGEIYYTFYLTIKPTQESAQISWTVQIATA